MIPILYDGVPEEDPVTGELYTNLGIGPLTEAVECTVTEERNSTYELKLRYPNTGALFHELQNSRIILATHDNSETLEPFRIYKISKPMGGVVSVYAEHISYWLNYIPVSPFTATTAAEALQGLYNNKEEDCPFTFYTDRDRTSRFTLPHPMSIRGALGGWEGSILERYGGEYEFTRYQVNLWTNRGRNRGFEVRYGKNMLDIQQNESIASTVTSVYPYYYLNDGENETLVTLPEKILDSEYADRYPFRRTACHDFTDRFQQPPTVEELRQVAQQYINYDYIGKPYVSMQLSFAQLSQSEEYETMKMMEEVNLCDTIKVYFEDLDIEEEARVNKVVYNVLLDRYDSISLGDVRTNLQGIIYDQSQNSQIERKVERFAFQNAIEYVTNQITGQTGGNVIIHRDANGKPYELLILDTDNITTAQTVWRWNLGGLGVSTTGYAGTYSTAMVNGMIVADIIRTGIMSGGNGAFSIDFDTGTINMKNANITGGSININTSTASTDAIKLSHSEGYSYLSPARLVNKNNNNKYTTQYEGGGLFTYKDSAANKRIDLIAAQDGTTNPSYLYLYDGSGNRASYLGDALYIYASNVVRSILSNSGLATYDSAGKIQSYLNPDGFNIYDSNGSVVSNAAIVNHGDTLNQANGYIRIHSPWKLQIAWKRVQWAGSINTAWGSWYENANAIDLGNWAAAFSEEPHVSIDVEATPAQSAVPVHFARSTTTAAGSIYLERPAPSTVSATYTINVIAIGRWT